MLREVRFVEQVPGEPPRRIFADLDFELIVWSEDGTPVQFQLSYDPLGTPRVLEFKNGALYHFFIDRADQDFTQAPRSGILRPAGGFDREGLVKALEAAHGELPEDIRRLVARAFQTKAASPKADRADHDLA